MFKDVNVEESAGCVLWSNKVTRDPLFIEKALPANNTDNTDI